jgi:hypothetical protein
LDDIEKALRMLCYAVKGEKFSRVHEYMFWM